MSSRFAKTARLHSFNTHVTYELEQWSALQGWDIQYLPRNPSNFEARFHEVELPRTLLQEEYWNGPMQLRGGIEGFVPVAIPLGGGGLFENMPFNSGDLIFLAPGSELSLLTQGPINLLTLHCPKNELEHVGWKSGIHNPLELLCSSPPVVLSPPSRRLEMIQGMRELCAVLPEFKRTKEELESSLLSIFFELVQTRETGRSRVAGKVSVGLKHLKLAQEFIEENLGGTIRMEDMAAVVGVSSRLLQLRFLEHFQMSPQQYVRWRRLHLVHKALERAVPETCTVIQVAMQYGFCHPSRFSMYYQQMFGETPSTTLRSRVRRRAVFVPAGT